jgi:chromate transporter
MNIVLLYFVLLKATVTSFTGLASLPAIQDALVVQHQVLTHEQLTQAVAITKSIPGPVGLYVVSVGYFVAGPAGALAGWLAVITPVILIIPLVHYAGARIEHPRAKTALNAVVIASAGLLLAASIPLVESAITGPISGGIAVISLLLLLLTKTDTLWIMFAAAAVSLVASSAGIVDKL